MINLDDSVRQLHAILSELLKLILRRVRKGQKFGDCQFLPDIESCFYDLITEFTFDGFSIDVCRSMVAMHDVSFSINIVI